jgi:hypothetical protein
MFDDQLVLQQLRYTGVLETIKIRKQGYSVRITFDEFMQRFQIVSFGKKLQVGRDSCVAILRQTGLTEWQIGKTKVFLKYWHVEALNELAGQVRRKITLCQAYWRAALARRQYAELVYLTRQLDEEISNLSAIVAEASNRLYQAQNSLCNEDEDLNNKQLESQIYDRHPQLKMASPDMTTIQLPPKEPSRQGLGLPRMPAILEQPIPPPADFANPPGFQSNPAEQNTIQILLDETTIKLSGLSTEIWGKVYYMEKNMIMGKVYLRDWDITMDDSNEPYDGLVIGVNTFDHSEDPESLEALKNIAQGIKIVRDEEGNIFIMKLSKNDVFIKGFNEPNNNCFGSDVHSTNGRLSFDQLKVFDMGEYKRRVTAELQKSDFDPHLLNRLSVIKLSFWRDRVIEVETPCWICIINFVALDLLGKENVFQDMKLKLKSKEASKLLQKWKLLNYNRELQGVGVGVNSPNKTMTRR